MTLIAGEIEQDIPDRFRRRQLSYAAVRRFIGRETLRPFFQYAKIPGHMASRIIMILHGQQIASFHYFLFPDLLSPQQLNLWGIPFGVAADLILHAEGFYIQLLKKEKKNAASSQEM
ncbi:hypothetical protein DFH28DRAFT_880255 [Melampsora americana]|nr:hypothetical protein DFH28DRAFT_880255 [Melampsora americana]